MSKLISVVMGMLEKLIRFLVEKVLGSNFTEQKLASILQFIRFFSVGLSNTVISYIIYVTVLLLFQRLSILREVDYLVAQFIGFVLSVLWSFYWNNKYVFINNGERRNLISALFKTYISYAFTGLFLNSILSIIWVKVFYWSKFIAPIINLLISVPLNFILNKFWAFRNK